MKSVTETYRKFKRLYIDLFIIYSYALFMFVSQLMRAIFQIADILWEEARPETALYVKIGSILLFIALAVTLVAWLETRSKSEQE